MFRYTVPSSDGLIQTTIETIQYILKLKHLLKGLKVIKNKVIKR